MRLIIYGVGAIGGVIAARLALSGQQVIGIARGRQLDAIQANGLLLRTPMGDETAHFTCVGHPREIDFRDDDAIFLTMKSQDTLEALYALRDAGVTSQAIVCAQNGIDNERMALRLFPNIYGCTVMMPGIFVTPGEVVCVGAPRHGLFDMGRATGGGDARLQAIMTVLDGANFQCFPHDDVMRSKYGKLVMNLGNVVDAALGGAARESGLSGRAREEAREVLAAAGIAFDDLGKDDKRRKDLLDNGEIEGLVRAGSSSAQSLARGTGSIETDYLNGEIVLLGRLHGVAMPVNAFLTRLGHRLIAENARPGSFDAGELKAELDAETG